MPGPVTSPCRSRRWAPWRGRRAPSASESRPHESATPRRQHVQERSARSSGIAASSSDSARVPRTRHSLPNRRENSVSEVGSGLRISDDVSASKCNSYARPAASDLPGARLTLRFGLPNKMALQLRSWRSDSCPAPRPAAVRGSCLSPHLPKWPEGISCSVRPGIQTRGRSQPGPQTRGQSQPGPQTRGTLSARAADPGDPLSQGHRPVGVFPTASSLD